MMDHEFLACDEGALDECVAYGNGGHGVQFTKSSTTAAQANKKCIGGRVRGGAYYENGLDGVQILSSDRIRVEGANCRNNSNSISTGSGVRVDSINSIPANKNFISVNAYDDQSTMTQKYGVNIDATTSTEANDNEVFGCQFGTHVTGPFNNTGTRTVLNGVVTLSQTAYDALVSAGTVNPIITYAIV